jgi:large subunit ribosomal protein L4
MPKATGLGGAADVTLDKKAFEAGFNGPLVHESVRAELNARRQGTASTKTRGQVRGGGAKPWRQKGTGRARAGSSRSPIWTGGGTVFGPSPRHYTFKINRKERRAALRSALSVHAERGSIATFDPAKFDKPSTSAASKLYAAWGVEGSLLVILTDEGERAALSFRNLDRVRAVLPSEQVGVADLLGAANVLASPDALDQLTKRANGEKIEPKVAAVVETPAPAKAAPKPAAKVEAKPAAKKPAAKAEAKKAAAKPKAAAKKPAAKKTAAKKKPAANTASTASKKPSQGTGKAGN